MFLVIGDVVGLHTRILYDTRLKALYKKSEDQIKNVPSAYLVDTAELVLKNNFFEFDSKVKQGSVIAIGTKFARPYTCIFMNKLEIDFLETQTVKPLVWLIYIDNTFFI